MSWYRGWLPDMGPIYWCRRRIRAPERAPRPLKTTPETASSVPGLDPRAASRWLDQPRTQSPWLHEEEAARMAERLKWFPNAPESWQIGRASRRERG